jgi:5-methylcytosine-specific restriction endonuclease McrA
MTRDEFRCQYCGIRRSPREVTCDHVVPVSRGGITSWDNLVTACKPCNHHKGSRTPDEAGMALARRPEKPKQLPLVPFQLRVTRVPDAWQTWVYWTSGADRIAAGA